LLVTIVETNADELRGAMNGGENPNCIERNPGRSLSRKVFYFSQCACAALDDGIQAGETSACQRDDFRVASSENARLGRAASALEHKKFHIR
jgi:hypothetical protein